MDEVPSPSGLSGKGMVVPIAAIGSLSQAWFDALGLARHRETPGTKPASGHYAAAHEKIRLPLSAVPQGATNHPQITALTKKHAISVRTRGIVGTRIEPNEKIRESIEVTASRETHHDAQRRSAGRITIRADKGVVKMLVQREDGRMRITAVCNPAIVGTVNDALQQARLRLQARGVQVELKTVEGDVA